MSEIVNLNRFRKAKRAEAAQQEAAENRIRFGRTKAERQRDTAKKKQARRELDGKRID